MNGTPTHRSAIALAAGLLAMLLPACVATVGAYGTGYDTSVGVGLDYYEPYGAFYGGWAPGYHVAPVRDGGHPGSRGGERGNDRAAPKYRPAPPARPVPSIPSRPRPQSSRPRDQHGQGQQGQRGGGER